ncbi:hypothetical protein ACKWRH_23545 [Bradyrhizobium sp. Pa8]|uniref:hypothetical protein n=1 Tax=Bradyrhizobium sp. Pa8 TaxID=3386552 RepID=UPI00403F5443
MTDAIKLKVLPQFPSRLIGRAGIDVSKQSGDYYLDLDYADFPVIGSVPAGATYALIFNPATGQYAQLPISLLGGGIADAPNDGQLYGRKNLAWSVVPGVGAMRELLTAGRTYFVASGGSDSNPGTSAGAPFATIQKAIDVCSATLDLGGQTVAVSVGAGTFAGFVMKAMTGLASLQSFVINGQGATTIINTTIQSNLPLPTGTLQNMQIATGVSAVGINGGMGSRFGLGVGISFGANVYHCALSGGCTLYVPSPLTVNASATFAFYCSTGALLMAEGSGNWSLNGTPNWGSFIHAENGANVRINSVTFTGAATGGRFNATGNATIFTNGGGANYLPGNTAGVTSNGGQYI